MKLVAKRNIDISVYEREDGVAYIVGTMLDTGHLIELTIAIDPKERKIVEASCDMSNYPFGICPRAELRVELLVGLRIEKGIMREISKAVGGGAGCVHIRELTSDIINFAATVLIGVDKGFGLFDRDFMSLSENEKYRLSEHHLKGTCQAYPVNKEES